MSMNRDELEREILEVCERVASARARCREYLKDEDMIRQISTLGIDKSYREAKHLLADRIRELAIAEDNLWREVVKGCVDRILFGDMPIIREDGSSEPVEPSNFEREHLR